MASDRMASPSRPTQADARALPAPAVTIAIPTYNRAHLLEGCLDSVLAQDHPNLHVVVLDNASTDGTAEIVAARARPRLTYLRNDANVGMFRNWKRAAERCTSEYLCLLQDDDRLLPSFVTESVAALAAHPNAGFCFGLFRHIDAEGQPLGLQWDADRIPDDRPIRGSEYLHQMVAGRGWEIHVSTVLLRAAALEEVGALDAPHSDHTHDFNLFLRLAARYDIAFTGSALSLVRIHPEQYTETNFRAAAATGNLALATELVDAAAYLLSSERASEPSYRMWLQERIVALNRYRSEMTQAFVRELNLGWDDRVELINEEISALVAPGQSAVLLDEDRLRHSLRLPGRRVLPFPEEGGSYAGPPAADEAAVRALVEQLERSGARFVIVAWPAFWWLDFYAGLRTVLEARFDRRRSNSRMVVFEARR